jgi:hypothetical protein
MGGEYSRLLLPLLPSKQGGGCVAALLSGLPEGLQEEFRGVVEEAIV